jgi:hypothetical protein
MRHKFLEWFSIVILTLMVVLAIPQIVNGKMSHPPGMVGHSGMSHDAQMIHQLFANHTQIHRTVKQLPTGIQAVTESDNPQVAALIQAHVASMYQRMANKQPIPMVHMAPTVLPLLQNADRYQRQQQTTAKGVTVTETTNYADLIATIREHAREMDEFVQSGMPSGMGGGMR